MNVPIIRYDADAAANAYEVHTALLKAERIVPSLKKNPQWADLRKDAFERFAEAFKALT